MATPKGCGLRQLGSLRAAGRAGPGSKADCCRGTGTLGRQRSTKPVTPEIQDALRTIYPQKHPGEPLLSIIRDKSRIIRPLDPLDEVHGPALVTSGHVRESTNCIFLSCCIGYPSSSTGRRAAMPGNSFDDEHDTVILVQIIEGFRTSEHIAIMTSMTTTSVQIRTPQGHPSGD